VRTRFAPSPTGPLHLGHAFSALEADRLAREAGGTFQLRIEDLDQSRARPHFEAQIYDDLAWLGLRWPTPVMRQSDRGEAYAAALDRLWDMGLLYPCSCLRRDIEAAASAPQEGAPLIGPDGIVYPGTCRNKPKPRTRPNGALRLDMRLATKGIDTVCFSEGGTRVITTARDMIDTIGDVVLARRDMAAAYHLAVVVDDADQGITHVVRGEDLAPATPIHRLLQILLGLPEPHYHHHRLIRDDTGKRLAKRDDARALATYRAKGRSADDIRAMLAQ